MLVLLMNYFPTPSTGLRSHRLNFVYSFFGHLITFVYKTVTETIIVYTSYDLFVYTSQDKFVYTS